MHQTCDSQAATRRFVEVRGSRSAKGRLGNHTVSTVACVFVAAFSVLGQSPSNGEQASTAPATRQVLQSYEGQTVSTVEIAGRPDLDTKALQQHLAIQSGQPFSRSKVDQSIATLKALGQFQDVQLHVLPELRGVRVLLVLHPGIYIGMYSFPGATQRFAYARLLQVSNHPPEGPYTAVDVENARQALIKFFQSTGYFVADVKPQLQLDQQHGIVNAVFQAGRISAN
jgi:outer membrane protein insertion porin family